VLRHEYNAPSIGTMKVIGIYKTREDATAAIERLLPMPGFADHPNDFIISQYPLDQEYWSADTPLIDS